MKNLRHILLLACMITTLAVAAEQPDPVISSIRDAYQKAKESIKKNKGMGNEMVTTLNYTVRGQGKSNETLHFYYNTVEGTYWLAEGDDRDPHFFYYPLYFVTRTYNIGKKKYYEEFKRFDRRFYFHDRSIYHVIGPEPTPFMVDNVIYQANELRLAFDWILRNPKE